MSDVCFSDRTSFSFFFFNDTATTEIYTLSLHDALPISRAPPLPGSYARAARVRSSPEAADDGGEDDQRDIAVDVEEGDVERSEEHTSELQSPCNLVCRLLLEKKKQRTTIHPSASPTTCR